jgi:hypothetical protein
MKSAFYLQKKKELLELIEMTLNGLLASEDLKKVDSGWLLAEILKIKKEVEEDKFSSKDTSLGVFSLKVSDDLIECDYDLWINVGKIGEGYRKLQRNLTK